MLCFSTCLCGFAHSFCSYQTCRQISHDHFLFVSMAMKTGFPALGEATVLCCSIGQEVGEKEHAQSAHGITLFF